MPDDCNDGVRMEGRERSKAVEAVRVGEKVDVASVSAIRPGKEEAGGEGR